MISEKKYNRIVNSCVLVAIFSAFMYERTEGWVRALVLSLGVIAAIVSVSTYFSNQSQSEKKGDVNE